MSKFFTLWLCFNLRDFCQTRRVDDICSSRYVRRVFLELGESGVLTAYNLTVARENVTSVTFHESCQMEVVACSSCIISLTFRHINLSCLCGSLKSTWSSGTRPSGINLYFDNPCRCDYIWITEPHYGDSAGVPFCGIGSRTGSDFGYRSKTRAIKISLFYSRTSFHVFTLDYKSELNRQFFVGMPEHPLQANLSAKSISSPFFPLAYPRDFMAEYDLGCLDHTDRSSNADLGCKVHLAFTDFQLAPSSVMEFYDGERRLGVASGSSFRPPAITTSTNTLKVRFFAGGQSNLGFKALFSFVSDDMKKMRIPVTDCGGYVDNFGGTIIMMNMVETETKLYDCIWLVRPLRDFVNFKSHLYLKVTTFLDFAGGAKLQVRQGLTSESPVLEELSYPMSREFKEHVLPLKSGYYVSLRAVFGPSSHFALTYASFSYNKCFFLSEFLCQNYRCISKKLTCDGFDHCGDNSDEPASCYRERHKESTLRRWYGHAPNYYFPKTKGYADLKTPSSAFLLGLVALVVLGSTLTTLIYRIGKKSRRQRDIRGRLPSVGEFLDGLSDEVSLENVVVADDPPSYEPPPTYEDVMQGPGGRK